jgi:hypothetical protein
MKDFKAVCHELPLFAGSAWSDPSCVWDTLDEVTRREVLERVAALLLAHVKADATGAVSAPDLEPGVNTP